MRQDIEFEAEGVTLRGWLYLPDDADESVPCIVMAHGLSAVKEMYLDKYAELFADAGLASLVYDNRNFGASEGEPRQEIDPWQQVRDYRYAITYAKTFDEIDGNRIGVWGSSYSGGHVLTVGALDTRVNCVVSQVPLVSGYKSIQRLVRPDILSDFHEQFNADREARFAGEEPETVPAVSEDLLGDAVMPTQRAYEWFTETKEERAPAWENEVTLRSVELLAQYDPADYIKQISPTPLLMVVAERDDLALADEQREAYNQALEPKKLEILEGGHFDAYVEEFETSGPAARDWFTEHLQPS